MKLLCSKLVCVGTHVKGSADIRCLSVGIALYMGRSEIPLLSNEMGEEKSGRTGENEVVF